MYGVWCAAMGKIGRNEPCPCGSGRKYKKCCLTTGGVVPYTAGDRDAALQRLLRTIHPDDIDDARDKLWGKHLPLRDQWNDPVRFEMVENALQFWLFFDELDGGLTLADETLEDDRDIRPGERMYLEMGRANAMRLYEVIGVEPGASLTLRDVLHGGEIRVRERAGSRHLHTWDLIAARVMPKGVSGQPEIDGGLFPLSKSVRDPLVKHLKALGDELDEDELKEAAVFVFFDAWIGPGMPRMVNYDGEPMLLTQVHFDVLDEGSLMKALDHAPDLDHDDVRESKTKVWRWVDKGKQSEEPIIRAFLRLEQGRLKIETNSRERGEGARALVERLAGASVKYRITEHRDLERAVFEHAREGKQPEPLPQELRELSARPSCRCSRSTTRSGSTNRCPRSTASRRAPPPPPSGFGRASPR
jgi:hypothetical protein